MIRKILGFALLLSVTMAAPHRFLEIRCTIQGAQCTPEQAHAQALAQAMQLAEMNAILEALDANPFLQALWNQIPTPFPAPAPEPAPASPMYDLKAFLHEHGLLNH